jgi:aldehyde:ferredoxin oxidoreductase
MVEGQIAVEEYTTGNTEHTWDLKKIYSAHKILTKYSYKKGQVTKGFANRTLYVNLSTGQIAEKPVTEEMKKKFTGGRGFGLKLMWDSSNRRPGGTAQRMNCSSRPVRSAVQPSTRGQANPSV